ncbi:unnamed protein product [Adineta steineri]|uniref:Uncharacterized protein n=1 Tax=Adineta steineri TaxID=433720 RepID=A0A814QZK2_9BILA|nr:unnamed protein product [Adineta steineri]
MNFKAAFHWLYEQIYNYNLFMLEETEYNDDEEDKEEGETGPASVLKQQKYTTWLYIFLLIVSCYILLYTAFMKTEYETITVFDVTPVVFEKLYRDHAETISCPCSTITVPLKGFVSNTITHHPICQSIFVSKKWIEALHFENASRYGTDDFRTTASSQFKILASLCSLSQDIVSQNLLDLDNNEFINNYLLSQEQVEDKVNGTIEFFKNSASSRIISFLNYLRTTTQADYLISALNTNYLIANEHHPSDDPKRDNNILKSGETKYSNKSNDASLDGQSMGCSNTNPTTTVSFSETSHVEKYYDRSTWTRPRPNVTVVSGFLTACTPLEAILQSTLDCLYIDKCLQFLMNYFPAISQMQKNWTNSVLSPTHEKHSVNDYLEDLFIEEWSTKMNYSKYSDKCNASMCTYMITDQTNFYSAITLFISLYGGLTIILRLIAPFLINIWLKCHSKNRNIFNAPSMIHIRKLGQFLKRLNLFKESNQRTEDNIKRQKISTRVYLILLIGLFLTLLLFTSLSTGMVPMTKRKPSLPTYRDLQDKYSKSLRCPCSHVTIPHRKFVSLSPVLHQVCKSDFVTEKWLSLLKGIRTRRSDVDWRNRAFSQFHLLSELCKLANKTINNDIDRFLSQPFIVSNVLPKTDFEKQLNLTLEQFFQSTIDYFDLLIKTVQILIQVDQPYSGPVGAYAVRLEGENHITAFIKNETNGPGKLEVKFRLAGPRNAGRTTCLCATDSHCNISSDIYDIVTHNGGHNNDISLYNVSGSIAGCSVTDSLLHSTLECYYSNSNCLQTLMNYSKKTSEINGENPSWFDVRPLDYNTTFSRFQPNTLISEIAQKIMIEQWNSSIAYDQFYESCAPTYCTYSQRIYKKNIFETMIMLLSWIGGLIFSLRLITPQLVNFVFNLLTKTKKERNQTQGNRYSDIYQIGSKNNIDRIKAKRLGQWATRLYLVLFAVGLVILTLHTIIRPQEFTKNFDKLTLNFSKQLFQQHKDKLNCPCSSIASPYNQFVNIKARFHEICSSPFASKEGRLNLTSNLNPNSPDYTQTDYRRFLSAHLQFLEGLCQLSDKTVNIFTQQFLSSLFVTNELLSEMNFDQRLNLTIKQSKLNIATTLTPLLFLIRMINNGNAFISTYGTNFQYIHPWKDLYDTYTPTQPIIYDDNCSCGLYSNCTTQATFIITNPSKIISIKGLKIGCTPSESFRASTLECFYNESCINLTKQYTINKRRMKYTNHFKPLSIINSSYSINTTIAELVDNLFIEDWNIKINYASYFEQCSPSLCSYNYIQRFNILHIVTTLIGLQGGLAMVLEWICPKIIRIIVKIYQYRKKRRNVVQPVFSIETIPTENIDNSVSTLESAPTNETFQDEYFTRYRSLLSDSSSVSLRVAVTDFNCDSYQDIAVLYHYGQYIGIFMNTGARNFKAQKKSFTRKDKFPSYFAVGDFNSDTLPDVAVSYNCSNFIDVFFGNGDGIVSDSKMFQIGDELVVDQIIVDDFNADGNLDIGFGKTGQRISLLVGDGQGNFKAQTAFQVRFSGPSAWTGVGDFNGDGFVDIINVDLNSTSQDVFLNVCK